MNCKAIAVYSATFLDCSTTANNSYITNSHPNKKNVCSRGMSSTYDCSICLKLESLLHMIAGCATYLNDGRFTWCNN